MPKLPCRTDHIKPGALEEAICEGSRIGWLVVALLYYVLYYV